jgi:hypothetical protein
MLAGIVLHAFATPKPSRRTATWYSMFLHPKSHVPSCPLSSGIALHPTLGSAERSHAKRLVYGQLFSHGTPFLSTLDKESRQFIALWNSQVMVSLDVWRVSRTTFFNAQWPLSVVKNGLPNQGFIVTVPSHFHFTITSPAIDLRNLRRVAMSLTDFHI